MFDFTNDDDNDDEQEKNSAAIGTKTSGMDDADDIADDVAGDGGTQDDIENVDDDGSSKANKPNSDEENADNNFGLLQTFKVPPGLYGFTHGVSDNFNEEEDENN